MSELSLAFDFDGTLVDSEKIKTDSYIQALQEYKLNQGNILTFLGKGNSEKYIKKKIFENYPSSKEIVDSVISLKNIFYKNNINRVNLFPDAEYLLKYLRQSNLHQFTGIVTSSSRDQFEGIMKNLSLKFAYTITSSETNNHKPDPEPYEKFKDLLLNSVQKKIKFIAIEDTIKGALSAEAAHYDYIFLIDRDQKLTVKNYRLKRIKKISSLEAVKDFLENYKFSNE